MREKLLKILKCKECNYNEIELFAEEINAEEVRSGNLICKKCKSKFLIEDGIVNFLDEPKLNIKEEQLGNLEHLKLIVSNISKYDPNIVNDIYSNQWCYLEPLLLIDKEVFGHEILAVFEEAIKKVIIKRDDVILDLGTGSCWTTNRLAKFSDNVIALDINLMPYIGLKSFELHSKQNKVYYERVLIDCNNTLPIKDKSVDLVFISAAFHHFINPDLLLKEIIRILKPSGKVLGIREPICGVFEKDSRFHISAREREKSSERAYSLRGYTKIFKKNGFKINILIKYLQELIQNLNPSDLDNYIYGSGPYPFKKISKIGRLAIYLLRVSRPLLESVLLRSLAYFGGNTDRFKFISFIYLAYPKKSFDNIKNKYLRSGCPL